MPASGSAAALVPPGGEPEPGTARTVKSSTAFRTISEVADELDVAQHVLRFWESKFPQVRPLKRGGGRRYYRPEDVELLRQIRSLLYDEGYTIKGAQKLLRARRARPAPGDAPEAREPAPRAASAGTLSPGIPSSAAQSPVTQSPVPQPAPSSAASAPATASQPAEAVLSSPSRQTAAELRRRLKPLLADLVEARDRLRARTG